MNRLILLALLLSTLCPSLLNAQPPPRPPRKPVKALEWTFGVGLRGSLEGPQTRFGNLGTIDGSGALSAAPGTASTFYDDGYVLLDAQRPVETQASTLAGGSGNYFTHTDATQTVRTGEFIAFNAAQTRYWGVNSLSQVNTPATPSQATFSRYSSESSGASLEGNGDFAGGFEITVARRLLAVHERLDIGVQFGFGLTRISVEQSGTVAANLNTVSDTYNIGSPLASAPSSIASAPVTNPSVTSFTNGGGTTFTPDATNFTQGLETTFPLSLAGATRSSFSTPGGASVAGNWEVEGGVFNARLGPTLRSRIVDEFFISGSIGGSLAAGGSTFRVDERLQNLPTATPTLRYTGSTEDSVYLAGYYADLNAEYFVTQRLGFYAGMAFEQLGSYDQTVGSRTAELEFEEGLGIRLGALYRF